MPNPACFLVSLSSLFLSFILSRFPFLCLRLAVRASVAPTVWRWSAAVAGVGAFAVVGWVSPVSVCRGGQDRSAVVAVAVRLAPRLYGRGGRGSAVRALPPAVGRSAFRSVDRRGGRSVAGGSWLGGRAVRVAVNRSPGRSAPRLAGGRWSGWIGGGAGLSSPRFASFQLFDVNFLAVTH